MNNNYLLKLLMLSLFFIFACDDGNTPEPEVTFDFFESKTRVAFFTSAEIARKINGSEFEDLESSLLHDVTVYKITYKTKYMGSDISASGLVAFPETSESSAMLVFHNGTNAKEASAPTNDFFVLPTLMGGLASTGYIAMLPDYIGFGSSSDIIHPYYRADITASTSMDMLRAVEELARDLDYSFNEDVFLSGYSEGGFATMATHKAMEESPMDGFNLVASAPASGGYDVKGMQDYFFGLTTYHQPFYLAFVAASYKTSYGFEQPLSDYFQEPFASNILDYFDGSLGSGEINANLTDVIADLLQPDFLDSPEDPKFANIVDKFKENSLNNWTPTIRMMMYHGDADITVPYSNSVDTYNDFINLGVSSDIVSFATIEGANHATGFAPYILDALNEFEELK